MEREPRISMPGHSSKGRVAEEYGVPEWLVGSIQRGVMLWGFSITVEVGRWIWGAPQYPFREIRLRGLHLIFVETDLQA
jgi:hypothetical protein